MRGASSFLLNFLIVDWEMLNLGDADSKFSPGNCVMNKPVNDLTDDDDVLSASIFLNTSKNSFSKAIKYLAQLL